MRKMLSLGYTTAETEDCKKKLLAAKNGGYTQGRFSPGITVTSQCLSPFQNLCEEHYRFRKVFRVGIFELDKRLQTKTPSDLSLGQIGLANFFLPWRCRGYQLAQLPQNPF